jgi:hypothetical protein
MHVGYWWESQKKETTRKTGVGERIILKLILARVRWYGLDVSGSG